MTGLSRVRVVWSGIPTGPGVSTFYGAAGGIPDLAALRAGLANLTTIVPAGISIQIENQGDIIDDAEGAIDGTWSSAAQTVINCTGTGSYAAPAGGIVQWRTDTIAGGKHLRGRTFVVPLASSAMGTNGRLLAGAVTGLSGLGAGVVGAGTTKFAVWHRPKYTTAPDGTRSLVSPGSQGAITSYKAQDRVVVLRSRRD